MKMKMESLELRFGADIFPLLVQRIGSKKWISESLGCWLRWAPPSLTYYPHPKMKTENLDPGFQMDIPPPSQFMKATVYI